MLEDYVWGEIMDGHIGNPTIYFIWSLPTKKKKQNSGFVRGSQMNVWQICLAFCEVHWSRVAFWNQDFGMFWMSFERVSGTLESMSLSASNWDVQELHLFHVVTLMALPFSGSGWGFLWHLSWKFLWSILGRLPTFPALSCHCCVPL